MAKQPTYPAIFDEALQINISKLKGWGYLEPGQNTTGRLSWNRNGTTIGSISFAVHFDTDTPNIELDYKYNGTPRNYEIKLVSTPSNLGIGEIWYFLCPKTNKRCRVLYSVNGWFCHREAFKHAMYNKQTKSKYGRQMESVLNKMFSVDAYYEVIYGKHFKKYFAGKPTKRYLRLLELIDQAERIDIKTLQRLKLI